MAALVPALVALDLGSVGRIITVVLGVIVAAATAVEHFLKWVIGLTVLLVALTLVIAALTVVLVVLTRRLD